MEPHWLRQFKILWHFYAPGHFTALKVTLTYFCNQTSKIEAKKSDYALEGAEDHKLGVHEQNSSQQDITYVPLAVEMFVFHVSENF